MAGWVGKAFGASRGEGAGDHLPGLLLPCALAGRPSVRPIARDTAWRALNAVFNALELQGQVGTHCLRKIFANAVHEANHYDLPKTQKALGHRNINSTLAYLSFREEDVELAILAAASRVLAA
jgi:integrase